MPPLRLNATCISHRSLELRQGKRVFVWVFEPSELCSARCSPDAQLILLKPLVALTFNPSPQQFFDLCMDVTDIPTKNGIIWRRMFLYFLHSQHYSMRVKDDCKGIVIDEP